MSSLIQTQIKQKCMIPAISEFSYRIVTKILQASSNLTYQNFKFTQLEINSKNKNFKIT